MCSFELVRKCLSIRHSVALLVSASVLGIVRYIAFSNEWTLVPSRAQGLRTVDKSQVPLISTQNVEEQCTSTSELWCSQLVSHFALHFPLGQPSCTAQRRIAYMKTHKTGSSTLANLLYRHALAHNLKTFFPLNVYLQRAAVNMDSNRIRPNCCPWPWHRQYVRNRQYEFFGYHTVWNIPAFEHLFGRDETSFVTIIRHPESHFESHWKYHSLEEAYGLTLSQYLERVDTRPFFRKRELLMRGNYGINGLIKELGFPADRIDHLSAVRRYIEQLDSHFDLVLLQENFYESAILLGDLLCIPIQNLTTFREKVRISEERSSLNERDRFLMRKHFKAEYLLYDHFKDKLESQIDRFGRDRMKKYTSQLRRLERYAEEKCEVKSIMSGFDYTNDNSTVVYLSNSTDSNCQIMTIPVQNFRPLLRQATYNDFMENARRSKDYRWKDFPEDFDTFLEYVNGEEFRRSGNIVMKPDYYIDAIADQ